MTEIRRGRQYETDAIPGGGTLADLVQPEPGPQPFNLMLRRPGERRIYLSPTYDDPDEWMRRDGLYDGTDERDDGDAEWCLSLPHKCDEWLIGAGAREAVLADARRFRDELDQAIGALESAGEPAPHRMALSVRQPTGGSYSVAHPPACHRLPYGERCEFDLALWRARSLLPRELGVYDVTVAGDVVEFTWVRALTGEDWHG